MTDERSFERTAQAWLEPGANQAPDRAIQAVLLAIETTPQERDLHIPWRFPTMNTPLRVGMAAVIGLLLLGAGIYIFGGSGQMIGGQSAATPTPTATSVPTASPNLITYKSARNAICLVSWEVLNGTGDGTSGLNPQIDGITDPTISDAARARKIAVLRRIRNTISQQLTDFVGLAVPADPPALAADHASAINDQRQVLRLMDQILAALAEGRLTDAQTLDTETGVPNGRIEAFEAKYGLYHCA
jgi:hypothetical protein